MPFQPKPTPGAGVPALAPGGQQLRVMGIDPGSRGALACLAASGEVLGLWDYPGDAASLWTLLASHSLLKCDLAAMEAQHGFALPRGGQIHPMQSAKINFGLGQNYGTWLGVIAVMGWPLEIVSTATWRKQALDSNVPKKPSKADLVDYARRRWPDQELPKSKDGRAEALCIAEYARQRLVGRAAA